MGNMYQWTVKIEVWPYSTDKGVDADQIACGDKCITRLVRADDIKEALNFANLIVEGIKTNPRVWQAPIMSIERFRPC